MTEWHIITCEYPPQVGGVSDYTHLLASALVAAGDRVHVWCPDAGCDPPSAPGVVAHRELGRFTRGDFWRLAKRLDEFSAPRRLLVQWVPHGYGYRSMNLYFCTWLWNRAALRNDRVEIMVHEPFLPFGRGSLKQNAAGTIHRIMALILLRAVSRVWVSIPAWENLLRPYAPARSHFSWLPIPTTVAPVGNSGGASTVRDKYALPGSPLLGHFGTYGGGVKHLFAPFVIECLRSLPATSILFMGHRSDAFARELASQNPELASRIHGTGFLPATDLSRHLASCDLMVQPYPDGVSSRRTSFMVALCHGIPTIATTGSLTEPFWSETNGVALARVGDTHRMLQLAHSLLNDPAARARMGAAARRLYDTRFDIKNVVQALRQSSNPPAMESAPPERAFSES